MPAPVVVVDLELLAESSLFSVEKVFLRQAYFAGMVSGLNIAKEYSRVAVRNCNPRLWPLLSGVDFPRPGLVQFISQLRKYTSPDFIFSPGCMAYPAMRYGAPGVYYYLGLSDATKVGILQVPVLFRYLKGDEWQTPTVAWLNDKYRWARFCLMTETVDNQ